MGLSHTDSTNSGLFVRSVASTEAAKEEPPSAEVAHTAELSEGGGRLWFKPKRRGSKSRTPLELANPNQQPPNGTARGNLPLPTTWTRDRE